MMETNDNYCVYIHRNTINNKAYIGITIHGDDPNRRWQNGNGYKYNQHFYNAIQKYGWDNFEHIIWVNGLSLENAQKIEIMLIALFNTTDADFGYNVSIGGECFSMSEVDIVKRNMQALEVKNQNRIQKSIELFKDRFDNGDENILRCQKCGAYFEKTKNQSINNKKRAALKKKKHGINRKYCDYCATYHKQSKKIIVCVDCGKEFVVKSKDIKTCRCDKCKQNNSKI